MEGRRKLYPSRNETCARTYHGCLTWFIPVTSRNTWM